MVLLLATGGGPHETCRWTRCCRCTGVDAAAVVAELVAGPLSPLVSFTCARTRERGVSECVHGGGGERAVQKPVVNVVQPAIVVELVCGMLGRYAPR